VPRAARARSVPRARARASRRERDVVVIGGGPGGSTTATLLAANGLDVLLLERERFPRDHVGESLLPATMPVLEALGVREAVEAAGFLKKWGATMVWGSHPEPWSWYFRETNRRHPHAFQVTRPQFDQILLENSRARGVDVREGHRVLEVLFDGGRATGVRYHDGDGAESTVRARFVVDASGQNALLGHALDLRRWDPFFRNLAVYGYFANARRLPDPDATNILVEAHADGWCWTIPLHTGVSSVGAVLDAERAQPRLEAVGVRGAFEAVVRAAPHTAALLEHAELVAGPFVVKDWSYVSDEVVGEGYILVGDAACFVDPLFSSGVHLAMSAGLLAAAYVTAALKDDGLREAAAPVYKTLYYTQYRHFHQLAKLFYSSNRTADSYFWEARRLVGDVAFTPRQAFITAVAGQPPQGYERVVLDRGIVPQSFAESVRAVEGRRAERDAAVQAAGGALLEARPTVVRDARVVRQPVLEGVEFVWGQALVTDSRPEGTPCSPLVVELLRRFDGRTSLRTAIRALATAFGLDPATVEEAARAAVRILYVDGAIEELRGLPEPAG